MQISETDRKIGIFREVEIIHDRTIDGQKKGFRFFANLGNTDFVNAINAKAEILARLKLSGIDGIIGPVIPSPEDRGRALASEDKTDRLPVIALYIDSAINNITVKEVNNRIKEVDLSTAEYQSMFEKVRQSLSSPQLKLAS